MPDRFTSTFRLIPMTENANGGTEAMLDKMVREIPKDLLSKVDIHVSRLGDYREDRTNIYYGHDLAEDSQATFLHNMPFDAYVFVSQWQASKFFGMYALDPNKVHVIHNAIDKWPYTPKKQPQKTIRLIYHTTPHRGLVLLWVAFKHLSAFYNIHLDVFSSFEAYGWSERNTMYQGLFDEIANHPKATYHGYKSNDVVREALSESDIFAYPNIWTETSCIALIEAMCHGLTCVHPNRGALEETSMGFTNMYDTPSSDLKHIDVFQRHLNDAIVARMSDDFEIDMGMVNSANDFYAGTRFGDSWIDLISSIV